MSSFCEIQHALFDQIILQSYADSQVIRVKYKANHNGNQHEIDFVGFAKKITLDYQQHQHQHPDLVDAIYGQSKQLAMVKP